MKEIFLGNGTDSDGERRALAGMLTEDLTKEVSYGLDLNIRRRQLCEDTASSRRNSKKEGTGSAYSRNNKKTVAECREGKEVSRSQEGRLPARGTEFRFDSLCKERFLVRSK